MFRYKTNLKNLTTVANEMKCHMKCVRFFHIYELLPGYAAVLPQEVVQEARYKVCHTSHIFMLKTLTHFTEALFFMSFP